MDWNDTISLWGGLASIVALLLTFIIFSMRAAKIFGKKLEAREKEMKGELRRISDVADAATTQSRRIDLYLYKESVLADARFKQLAREISLLSVHILAAPMFGFIYFMQSPEKYLINSSFVAVRDNAALAKLDGWVYQNYGFVIMLTVLLFLALDIRLSWRLGRTRRKINMISDTFTSSYKDHLSKKNDEGIDLKI